MKKIITLIIAMIFLSAMPLAAQDDIRNKSDNIKAIIQKLETRKQIIRIRAEAQVELLNRDIAGFKRQLAIEEAKAKKSEKKDAKKDVKEKVEIENRR